MNALVAYSINENDFVLSPERVMYWEQQKTLIIADLHIGKTGHFRKSGIPVPQTIYKDDLHCLFTQILFFKAEQLIIVGDLSHSRSNREMELFKKWRHDISSLSIRLVNGNHDILETAWYRETEIKRSDELQIENFLFVHDPDMLADNKKNKKLYAFCGHLHPGISIKGRGRQTLQFPCFYFAPSYGVLPAFSRFTGMAKTDPAQAENVFAIVENGIVQVK